MDENGELRSSIYRLFRECVLLVVERCRMQPPGRVISVTTENGNEIRQMQSIDAIVDGLKPTEPFKNLIALASANLNFQGLFSRIGHAIKASIHYTVDERRLYTPTEKVIDRSCKEFYRCLSIQPYRLRISAPLYALNLGKQDLIQLEDGMSIRAVNSIDRDNARKNQITSQDSLEDYGAVIEKVIDTDDLSFDFGRLRERSLATERNFELIASCLRIFAKGLVHVRFIVDEQIEGYPDPSEIAGPLSQLRTGIRLHMASRLSGMPELAVYRGTDRSRHRQALLSHIHAKDLPIFVKSYCKAIKRPFFARAIRRFERALMSWDSEDIFTDLVLALEALLGGSMADVCYRAASLVGSSIEIRTKVHDFLLLVYSQRNPVMNGSKAFGSKFGKALRKSYGDTRDRSWFLDEFTFLVRKCLRYAALSDNLLGNSWNKDLSCNLLQHVDNSSLVKGIPSWMEAQMRGWL